MPPDPAPVPRARPADELAVEEVVLRCFSPLLAALLGAPEDGLAGERLPAPTLVELAGTGCGRMDREERVKVLVQLGDN